MFRNLFTIFFLLLSLGYFGQHTADTHSEKIEEIKTRKENALQNNIKSILTLRIMRKI